MHYSIKDQVYFISITFFSLTPCISSFLQFRTRILLETKFWIHFFPLSNPFNSLCACSSSSLPKSTILHLSSVTNFA